MRVVGVADSRFSLARVGQLAFVSHHGTDFEMIYEPSRFDRKWFSHKFHGPGLRYEVGLSIFTGEVNGGVSCGRRSWLLH